MATTPVNKVDKQKDVEKRERIVKVEEAPGKPFDAGRFALLLEPIDGSG